MVISYLDAHYTYKSNKNAILLILLGLRDLNSVFRDNLHQLMHVVYTYTGSPFKQYFEGFLHDSARSGAFYHDAEVWNTFIATRLIQFLMDPPR